MSPAPIEKWIVLACSTSAPDLRVDHTSCGSLHYCLYPLFFTLPK